VLFHSEKSHPQLLSCVCQFHEKNNNKFSKKCSNRNYYYNNNKKNQNSNQEEATTTCILQLFRRRPHNRPTTNMQNFYATRLLTIFIIKNYYAVSLSTSYTVFKKIMKFICCFEKYIVGQKIIKSPGQKNS